MRKKGGLDNVAIVQLYCILYLVQNYAKLGSAQPGSMGLGLTSKQ